MVLDGCQICAVRKILPVHRSVRVGQVVRVTGKRWSTLRFPYRLPPNSQARVNIKG